ncbi:hypothetical protein [Streptomyces anulatus]|uniref:hypothetical protein n=1 Tax=Streptomyces anulatus TaxID=1892 RepID=UPI0038692F2F|nr:hypothetical protein OG238_00900 [Streptomyces anulatus]
MNVQVLTDPFGRLLRGLACPRDAVWDRAAVGQWVANLRRPSGLGPGPVRADEQRRALEAIAPD